MVFEGGLPQVPRPNPAPFRVRGFEHTAPPYVGTRELGGIAQVPGTPPRVRGNPLGPISQCIDTNREDQFGIPLRKYWIPASAGSCRRGSGRSSIMIVYVRVSRGWMCG